MNKYLRLGKEKTKIKLTINTIMTDINEICFVFSIFVSN